METTRRAALAAALAAPALAGRAMAQAPVPAALPQAPGWYRFKLGGFTVTTVFDGFARRSTEGLVRNAPMPEVQATLAGSSPAAAMLAPSSPAVGAIWPPVPVSKAISRRPVSTKVTV